MHWLHRCICFCVCLSLYPVTSPDVISKILAKLYPIFGMYVFFATIMKTTLKTWRKSLMSAWHRVLGLCLNDIHTSRFIVFVPKQSWKPYKRVCELNDNLLNLLTLNSQRLVLHKKCRNLQSEDNLKNENYLKNEDYVKHENNPI